MAREDGPRESGRHDDDGPDRTSRDRDDTGTGNPRSSRGQGPVTPGLISSLRSLIQILEAEVPEGYRVEMFRLLAPGVLPELGPPSPAPRRQPDAGTRERVRRTTPAGGPGDERLDSSRLDLAPYAGVLSSPGRTLLRALAALDVAAAQLGVHWMTPAEVERFLVDRAGARSIYRTNLSSALGKARGLVDRRRKGRGFEYRLTALGRDTLHRELMLLGE